MQIFVLNGENVVLVLAPLQEEQWQWKLLKELVLFLLVEQLEGEDVSLYDQLSWP